MKFKIISIILLLTCTFAAQSISASEINIYSHRQPFLINPFLKAFTEETGIGTNVVYSTKGLAQRLRAEGKNSLADVILTVDVGRLYIYEDMGLLAEIDSEILDTNIPEYLKSAHNTWFGLSKRSRIIASSRERVSPDEILRIEDLADPKWTGKICSRPGSHVYNRALMASIIAAHGLKKAEIWAKGVVSNLARRPQGNDRAQVKAIYEGLCDIAIINNYYFGKLKYSEDPAQREWAASMRLTFPNQGVGDRGAHVNISGGGVAKYSKRKSHAIKLLEFLASPKAQRLYSEINFEYPVNKDVKASEELRSWGSFREDKVSIEKIAQLSIEAQKVIDKVGW